MALPAPIISIMDRRLGLITRPEVLALGVPPSTLDGWLARGELEAAERGVYRRPGTAPSEAQTLLAAVLRAGDGVRITGWSACALYGLEGFDLRSGPCVAVPSRRRVRGVAFTVMRQDLSRTDLATVAGLPAVTPMRALIDAAGPVSRKTMRVGIDDARRKGLIELERLLRSAVDLRRHRGALAILRLFDTGMLDQDGELERQLALALADVGLRPAWGMEVLPGVIADACFPEASYILECDGGRWHTIDSDRASDEARTGALLADGWLVDRIRAVDLDQRRSATVADVRSTRRDRMRRGLGRPAQWRPVRSGRRLRPPGRER